MSDEAEPLSVSLSTPTIYISGELAKGIVLNYAPLGYACARDLRNKLDNALRQYELVYGEVPE